MATETEIEARTTWMIRRRNRGIDANTAMLNETIAMYGRWFAVVPESELCRTRDALAELVRLKDGPRDDAYRAAKKEAWQRARNVLRVR